MGEKFTLFWKGVFGQWRRSYFDVDGVRYSHAEQFMMAEKARLFGDEEAEKAILASNSPREQQAIGRRVKPFDKGRWDAVARDVVYRGNRAKFLQNPDMLAALLATQGTTLVEASPTDRIWGIGLAEDNPLALDRKNWRGTNWLGETLTRLRDDIIRQAEVNAPR